MRLIACYLPIVSHAVYLLIHKYIIVTAHAKMYISIYIYAYMYVNITIDIHIASCENGIEHLSSLKKKRLLMIMMLGGSLNH